MICLEELKGLRDYLTECCAAVIYKKRAYVHIVCIVYCIHLSVLTSAYIGISISLSDLMAEFVEVYLLYTVSRQSIDPTYHHHNHNPVASDAHHRRTNRSPPSPLDSSSLGRREGREGGERLYVSESISIFHMYVRTHMVADNCPGLRKWWLWLAAIHFQGSAIRDWRGEMEGMDYLSGL